MTRCKHDWKFVGGCVNSYWCTKCGTLKYESGNWNWTRWCYKKPSFPSPSKEDIKRAHKAKLLRRKKARVKNGEQDTTIPRRSGR